MISASSSVLPGNFILMSSKACNVRLLSSSSLSRTAASRKTESFGTKNREVRVGYGADGLSFLAWSKIHLVCSTKTDRTTLCNY